MLDWDNLRVFLEAARAERLSEAAKRLRLDHSTVSRRVRKFEQELGTQLFDRTNQGYALTPAGHRLLEHVERLESTVYAAQEEVVGRNQQLSGQVRLGATEAFGCFFLAPHLAHFCARHPHMTVDLLTYPRFVNLSKREADLAITIERPQRGDYVVTKLSDYRLQLFATADYLATHEPIRRVPDLAVHRLMSYVDDLVFSTELRYMEDVAPGIPMTFRSTNVVAQYTAALRGQALAVLPCFLANLMDDLVQVLQGEVEVIRTFWLVAPIERQEVARVKALWRYLREVAEHNHDFLMGMTRTINWLP